MARWSIWPRDASLQADEQQSVYIYKRDVAQKSEGKEAGLFGLIAMDWDGMGVHTSAEWTGRFCVMKVVVAVGADVLKGYI